MRDAGPRILCLGHDPLLNRTRRLILEPRFQVRLANTLAEATALLASEPCDLVLLCYSLTDDECGAMVEFIHKLTAETKILVLVQDRCESLLLRPQDEEFVSAGPAELLSKALSMVGSPESGTTTRQSEKGSSLAAPRAHKRDSGG